MTTTLRFEDINATFVFEIKTNLINATDDNFTAMEITGVSDSEVILGVDFKRLPYTVAAMKTFAYNKGLKLTRINGDGTETILSALNANTVVYYGGLGLGIDNI